MLQIDVVTLFPDMFAGVLSESILKRAIDSGQVAVRLINFRDFAMDKHRTVDDTPFGGGAGMLLKAGPLFDAVESITSGATSSSATRVVLMSPQGRPFNQEMATAYAQLDRIVLVCGHYEGFDERIVQHLVTDEISLGDFVLTGGEIPAMAVIDAVARLLPGTLGNDVSAHDDSYSSGLLEYPQYTRPAVFREWPVPQTLLSGNHKLIAEWRHRHALYRTWARRPELLQSYPLSERDRRDIAKWESGDFSGLDVLEPRHAQSSSGDR